jgi:hypothetical protein
MLDRTNSPLPGSLRQPLCCISSLSLLLCLTQAAWPADSSGFAQAGSKSVLENPQAVAAAAATTVIHNPTGALGILVVGKARSLWEGAVPVPQGKPAALPDRAPTVDPDILAEVEDRAPVRNAAENYAEAAAYNYLLVQANATPVTAFAKSARRDLTFAHLFEESGKYRGQIVHIEGRLKRLRRFDAPRLAAKQGVPLIYEAWIFGEAYFSNPYCVIATSVPESVPLADTLDHHVAFDGYFFKRYRYQAGDGWRDAPLLIGHALLDRESGVPDSAGSMAWLLPALLTVVAGTVFLVVALSWWFRRSDRRVRMHLEMNRNVDFVEPGPHGP